MFARTRDAVGSSWTAKSGVNQRRSSCFHCRQPTITLSSCRRMSGKELLLVSDTSWDEFHFRDIRNADSSQAALIDAELTEELNRNPELLASIGTIIVLRATWRSRRHSESAATWHDDRRVKKVKPERDAGQSKGSPRTAGGSTRDRVAGLVRGD